MPIFVQWKWKERTKSFLVIFHFYDDFSKPNLRMKMKKYEKPRLSSGGWTRGLPVVKGDLEYVKDIPVMTWAPSHPELGFLSELLSYANIIDGLSLSEKRILRPMLEPKINIIREEGKVDVEYEMDLDVVRSTSSYITGMSRGKPYCGFELRFEYIEFLRKLLEPYLK